MEYLQEALKEVDQKIALCDKLSELLDLYARQSFLLKEILSQLEAEIEKGE